MTARTTRYPELGYRMDSPGNWRIVATETDQSIGPYYASKAELLADLYRYAKEYDEKQKIKPLAPGSSVARHRV